MEQIEMQNQLALPTTYKEKMTPETERRVMQLQSSIDIHDGGKVIAYGREEQMRIGAFYDSILKGIGTNEVGEAGDLLTKVIGDISGYNATCEEEKKGFFSFLKRKKAKLQTLQTKYKSVSDNIDGVVKELQKKDFALGQVSRKFEVMYEENLAMYEFLGMIIYAGEQVVESEKAKLEKMNQEAQMSGDLMEAQKVSDFGDNISRFERRLYDLKLSRTIALQQAPQIRMTQKSAEQLSESIKTAIVTSIPLWKSQMAIALGMQVVREGLNAVGSVRDATNAMLINNSEMNKQLVLDVANAAEKGMIDIETINTVNQNLIASLEGSCDIASKAIAAREEGAKKLQENEAELKAAIISYA